VNSINTQFLPPYRSRCVAEYRHSSSYLGATMGAKMGLEDPVGPSVGFRGLLPSAEVFKIIGRALPPAIADCRRTGGRIGRQDNSLMKRYLAKSVASGTLSDRCFVTR
jgi:hypothetical protein